jgi:hypothetical protein
MITIPIPTYLKPAHNAFLMSPGTIFEIGEAINCDYINCAAGMGMAGNGRCFLSGDGAINCKEFITDESFRKEHEEATGAGNG